MEFFRVTTAAVEQYTGEGEPPYCEMTLRAADGSTPPDFTLPVTLTGVMSNLPPSHWREWLQRYFGKSEQDRD